MARDEGGRGRKTRGWHDIRVSRLRRRPTCRVGQRVTTLRLRPLPRYRSRRPRAPVRDRRLVLRRRPAVPAARIASALLDRVIADAAARGATWIEGYPLNRPEASDAGHFRGPRSLYDARRFEPIQVRERDTVVRRSAIPARVPSRGGIRRR